MSEKRGLFGRMFGGKADDETTTSSPKPVAESGASADDIAAPTVPADTPQTEPPKKSWLQRLTGGMSKTSGQLTEGITSLFTKRKLDAATLDDLEDILIQADLGVETATRISDQISSGRYDKGITPEEVRAILADEVTNVLKPVTAPLEINEAHKPHVILVVGVNGAGKTTTIGKLAAQFKADGKTVQIAAGDTFRAAAIEQLMVWGQRVGAPVHARDVGSDPAGLAFDALTDARSSGSDVLMIDTAGRLQNKQELMDELDKIVRVIRKVDASAPHSVLLVLDATTGQNAMNQVEVFGARAGVTGLIMTKLDGTARGGILVAIAAKHQIPVHAIGVGEGIEDLSPFDAREFADALARP
ncbi:MAG: signal recognition particle-docking protein FtsY [Pseudomonadota bacterium]